MPTKNSTPHIAHETLPPGAVNSLGQMKVIDSHGIVRFIDMKTPRVLNAEGVPVKPGQA